MVQPRPPRRRGQLRHPGLSRRASSGWRPRSVGVQSARTRFRPRFSRDGRFVYFCSDRPGGIGKDDSLSRRGHARGFRHPRESGARGQQCARRICADAVARWKTPAFFQRSAGRGAAIIPIYGKHKNAPVSGGAVPLAGAINTAGDQFDASFLSDSRTIVFARAPSMQDDRIDLFAAALRDGRYDAGVILPSSVNDPGWRQLWPDARLVVPDRLTFSSRRGVPGRWIYRIAYRPLSSKLTRSEALGGTDARDNLVPPDPVLPAHSAPRWSAAYFSAFSRLHHGGAWAHPPEQGVAAMNSINVTVISPAFHDRAVRDRPALPDRRCAVARIASVHSTAS